MSSSSDIETHKLNDDSQLRTTLENALTDVVDDEEDVSDILDYTFAMISNGKTVTYIVNDLLELTNEVAAQRIGQQLESYFGGGGGSSSKKDSVNKIQWEILPKANGRNGETHIKWTRQMASMELFPFGCQNRFK
jgi:hypothetical protein